MCRRAECHAMILAERQRGRPRMMPIILRLIRMNRQACQGTKVRRKTVKRVGRVTYGSRSPDGAVGSVVATLYSGMSGQPGRSLAL